MDYVPNEGLDRSPLKMRVCQKETMTRHLWILERVGSMVLSVHERVALTSLPIMIERLCVPVHPIKPIVIILHDTC